MVISGFAWLSVDNAWSSVVIMHIGIRLVRSGFMVIVVISGYCMVLNQQIYPTMKTTKTMTTI